MSIYSFFNLFLYTSAYHMSSSNMNMTTLASQQLNLRGHISIPPLINAGTPVKFTLLNSLYENLFSSEENVTEIAHDDFRINLPSRSLGFPGVFNLVDRDNTDYLLVLQSPPREVPTHPILYIYTYDEIGLVSADEKSGKVFLSPNYEAQLKYCLRTKDGNEYKDVNCNKLLSGDIKNNIIDALLILNSKKSLEELWGMRRNNTMLDLNTQLYLSASFLPEIQNDNSNKVKSLGVFGMLGAGWCLWYYKKKISGSTPYIPVQNAHGQYGVTNASV